MSAAENRIVHVPRRFAPDEWGGVESVLFNLCREQKEHGQQPEIHTSTTGGVEGTQSWHDIPLVRYRYLYPFFGIDEEDKLTLEHASGDLFSLELFYGLVRLEHVRLYHSHTLRRMGASVLTAARVKRRPCVVSIHEDCFDRARQDESVDARNVARNIEWGKPFGLIFRAKRLLRDADAVICSGFDEFAKARDSLGHDRIFHLPDGVQPNAFASSARAEKRAELNFGPNDIVFGCLSRIGPQKGQMVLARAFRRLAGSMPSARLLIAGTVTKPEYEAGIRDFFRAEELEDRVVWQPPYEPESTDHAALLAATDIFVFPSRHEPFGIVVLEAWAAGKPVIATFAGGLRYIIENERNGLHVEPGDDESLAAAMKRLADEPGLAASLARAGRRLVEEKYDWKSIHARLEEIYAFAEERQARH